MQYIRGTREFRLAYKTAVTLGKFDGLHRGHQKLLSEVFRRAGDDMMSAVFTFETAPGSLMSGKPMATITTNAERRDKLEKAGVDYLVEYPFNKEVAKMDPEEFVSHVLVEQMHARAVVVGSDCRFGHKAAGDAPGKAFFPILPKDSLQLFTGKRIDRLPRRHFLPAIHAHVQRRVAHERKAASALVQLMG